MITMEIALDEDKIRAEGEYDVELIKYNICRLFYEKKLCKIETLDGSIVHCGANRDEEVKSFGYIILFLAQSKWFVRYVKKWTWDRDGNREDIREAYPGVFL